jgi:hypothetical protein
VRRENISVTHAARLEGVDLRTVRKYASGSLSREGRQWVVAKEDHFLRYLALPGSSGLVTIPVRSSKEARQASAYLAAVARWARSGNERELAGWRGWKIGDHELLTDPRTLRELRDAGLLHLDQLYSALKDVAG